MSHFLRPVLALLTVLASAGSTLAQDDSARVGQSGDQLVYEAEGHRLTATLPLWFAGGEDMTLADQEIIITGDDNSTRFEIVPGGQDAELWTYMYGARIVLEPERDLSEYRRAAAFGYALSCHGETGQVLLADEDTEDELSALIFICGQFVPEANRPGEGEIMTMAFRRTDAGIAVVYEEFRTPTFDGRDATQWPVSPENVVTRARALLAGAELIELDG